MSENFSIESIRAKVEVRRILAAFDRTRRVIERVERNQLPRLEIEVHLLWPDPQRHKGSEEPAKAFMILRYDDHRAESLAFSLDLTEPSMERTVAGFIDEYVDGLVVSF